MRRFLISLILIPFISCTNKTQNSAKLSTESRSDVPIEKPVKEDAVVNKIIYYFELNRIVPSVIINNTEGNQTEIQLLNHKIKWYNSEDETKIKIDNDLFTLKGQVTLNKVRENKDSVDFVNNWDEIKLFKYNGRELIGIRMSYDPCTGIGCSFNSYLVYDVLSKTKNFFGTFRTNTDLELFDFNKDGKLDYVSKTYIEDSDGVATEITNLYELFSMEKDGNFILQLDDGEKPYFLKRTFDADSDKEIDKKFEQNWITKIK